MKERTIKTKIDPFSRLLILISTTVFPGPFHQPARGARTFLSARTRFPELAETNVRASAHRQCKVTMRDSRFPETFHEPQGREGCPQPAENGPNLVPRSRRGEDTAPHQPKPVCERLLPLANPKAGYKPALRFMGKASKHPAELLRLGTVFLVACLFAVSCVTTKPGDLVEVKKLIPNVVLDIRYATTNNFTGQKLYESNRTFLRRAVAEKLRAAQQELNRAGVGLKIYDAYRPISVQKKMWAIFPQEGYVANPAKGSRHNRGAAVDVTLIDLRDKKELLMPSGYDEFSEKAHRNYMDAPEEAIRNRELLERVMKKHGFTGLPTEWWHFDDVNWKNYELLDIDSARLKF